MATNISLIELDETDTIDVAFVNAVRGETSLQLDGLHIRDEGAVLRWLDTTGSPDLQFTAFVPWSNIKYLSQVKELA